MTPDGPKRGRGRPPGPGGRKQRIDVRMEPPLIAALSARAEVLSAGKKNPVPISEVVRAACLFYLESGPYDPAQHFAPEVWIRT